jgi:flagellar hook assembly protein FlgD
MPKMGRAPQYTKNSANDARIARESMAQKQKKLQNRLKQQKGGKPQDPTKAVKEGTSYDNKLVDNLTGYREKTVYRNGPHNQMGKNEFLKLLSHQLRNQDPMNPMDQNKFSAELAQFAQLEQLSNLNTKFDKMNPNVNTEDKFYGASFLGKEVITSGTTVNYKGGGDKADLYFNLAEPADKMVLRIIDKNGNIVNEFWREKMSAGAHKLYWDGYDLAGNPENAGEFNIKVQAWIKRGLPLQLKLKFKVKLNLFTLKMEKLFLSLMEKKCSYVM